MKFYIYDLETMFNFFSFTGKCEGQPELYIFEISDRINQRSQLLAHLSWIRDQGYIMVGYNNLGFDYPIIHNLIMNPYTFDHKTAHKLCRDIIDSSNYSNPGAHRVFMSDRLIPQVDLVKINHFDNKAKRTSLKALQFAMRSESVEDLPYDPNLPLTVEQMDNMLEYNVHDVIETEKFLNRCRHLIEMRQELLDNRVIGGDVLNYSDVKIGVEYLTRKIGRSKCYAKGSKVKQTMRTLIPFKDIILPKTSYREVEFQAVHDWFSEQQIDVAGGTKPKHEARLGGIDFHFGLGGVHASVENKVYRSNDTHVIKDIDVSGMYVAVAISNGFYPEHLGKDFVTAYKQIQSDRKQYPKGTAMNALLKLAGNGVYGNSNNPYSCFYDPKYTFSVTVNGQLQLLELVERLSLIPGLEIIQANTDGVTVYIERELENFFHMWCQDWEIHTGLKLEEVEYSRMWIRDVNNYLAETVDGELKRKGAYWFPEVDKDYDGGWNKDFSNLASVKVAEQVMLNGCKPESAIKLISNPFDLMLRYKTPGGANVYLGDKKMLKTVRYYVSNHGHSMRKVSKPRGEIGAYKRANKLTDVFFNKIMSEIPEGTWDERIHTKNKSKYTEVTTSIQSGWLVNECNKASSFNWSDVNWDYYIKEAEKLIIR